MTFVLHDGTGQNGAVHIFCSRQDGTVHIFFCGRDGTVHIFFSPRRDGTGHFFFSTRDGAVVAAILVAVLIVLLWCGAAVGCGLQLVVLVVVVGRPRP